MKQKEIEYKVIKDLHSLFIQFQNDYEENEKNDSGLFEVECAFNQVIESEREHDKLFGWRQPPGLYYLQKIIKKYDDLFQDKVRCYNSLADDFANLRLRIEEQLEQFVECPVCHGQCGRILKKFKDPFMYPKWGNCRRCKGRGMLLIE